MLNVKVKTESMRFYIPVPYVIINIGISLISSQLINRLINKWVQESMKEKEQTFTMPPLNRKELKSIVSELKKHRGLRLLDVKAKDGTEVVIKL